MDSRWRDLIIIIILIRRKDKGIDKFKKLFRKTVIFIGITLPIY